MPVVVPAILRSSGDVSSMCRHGSWGGEKKLPEMGAMRGWKRECESFRVNNRLLVYP